MARQESDREDLWAEAVALSSRLEFLIPGHSTPCLAGFRDNGWVSFYFGQDVMLQFTADAGLRRAFREGFLFRSRGEQLSRLRRRRTEHQTELLRSELSPSELRDFQAWVFALLTDLASAIATGQIQVRREMNAGPPLLPRIQQSLQQILSAERFLAPAIGPR